MTNHRNNIPRELNKRGLKGKGVEVGVFKGNYSEEILNTWEGTLFLVDAWASLPGYDDALSGTRSTEMTSAQWEAVAEECKATVERFGSRATILRMTSEEASKTFKDGELDFVYIDANHSEEGCAKDIALWFPKVKAGGFFGGHDYLSGERKGTVFGVKDAVDAMGLQVNVTGETLPSWYLWKMG